MDKPSNVVVLMDLVELWSDCIFVSVALSCQFISGFGRHFLDCMIFLCHEIGIFIGLEIWLNISRNFSFGLWTVHFDYALFSISYRQMCKRVLTIFFTICMDFINRLILNRLTRRNKVIVINSWELVCAIVPRVSQGDLNIMVYQ